MLSSLFSAYPSFLVFPGLHRRHGFDHGAHAGLDSPPHPHAYWSAGARRRPAKPFGEARHAYHGRRHYAHRHCDYRALVVPPSWSFVAALLATLCTAALSLLLTMPKRLSMSARLGTPQRQAHRPVPHRHAVHAFCRQLPGHRPHPCKSQVFAAVEFRRAHHVYSVTAPICPDGSLDIPWLYLVFCYLLIIGMSNAW